ncbi:MAG: HAAS signaling domain-containing protein [Blautia sp.]|jgi:uncharacterized membrane protein
MSREEFLQILREQLLGELEEAQVSSHVQYYDQYIKSQTSMGYTEEEVTGKLGDPRLIAKTLIDTRQSASEAYGTYEQMDREVASEGTGGTKKNRWLDLSTWYGKALVILIAAGVIVLVLTVLSALLPFLLVIFCISILVRYFRNSR